MLSDWQNHPRTLVMMITLWICQQYVSDLCTHRRQQPQAKKKMETKMGNSIFIIYIIFFFLFLKGANMNFIKIKKERTSSIENCYFNFLFFRLNYSKMSTIFLFIRLKFIYFQGCIINEFYPFHKFIFGASIRVPDTIEVDGPPDRTIFDFLTPGGSRSDRFLKSLYF